MLDPERALISKMVQSGAVESVLARGIGSHHFMDPDCQAVFDTCSHHVKKYNSTPSLGVITKAHPSFTMDTVTDALGYTMDQFVQGVTRREAITTLRDLADAVDDPGRVADITSEFYEASHRLGNLIPVESAALFSDMPKRIELWKQMKKDGTMAGIPMGIPTFDNETLGVQKHEYVSIVGWQGTGKSTMLGYNFFYAYLKGFTPMLVSLEMGADQLYRKWDVMAANFEKDAADAIRYYDVKALKLKNREIRELERVADRVSKAKNDIIVIEGVGKIDVGKVYGYAARYKPDMVGVDYISLMDAPRGKDGSLWEKVTYITGELKGIAKSLSTPIFGIAQTNIASAEDGAQLQNIAYSRSIGQDSDLVFGLAQDELQKENNQMTVRMLKNRDGRIVYTDLLWDMETMRFREWKVTDMFQRRADGSTIP